MNFFTLRLLGWIAALVWLTGLPMPSQALALQHRDLARQSSLSSNPKIPAACPTDLVTLTTELLRDLPSYANRVIQSTRLVHAQGEAYSYVIVAGRPEFAPLTLGPGEYLPPTSIARSDQQPKQVFITTLERQYITGREIDLQGYHWLFLVQTPIGWQLAMMFSSIGTYPATRPPTPPRDSSHGVIAQAIRTWLEDCRAGTLRRGEG